MLKLRKLIYFIEIQRHKRNQAYQNHGKKAQ